MIILIFLDEWILLLWWMKPVEYGMCESQNIVRKRGKWHFVECFVDGACADANTGSRVYDWSTIFHICKIDALPCVLCFSPWWSSSRFRIGGGCPMHDYSTWSKIDDARKTWSSCRSLAPVSGSRSRTLVAWARARLLYFIGQKKAAENSCKGSCAGFFANLKIRISNSMDYSSSIDDQRRSFYRRLERWMWPYLVSSRYYYEEALYPWVASCKWCSAIQFTSFKWCILDQLVQHA